MTADQSISLEVTMRLDLAPHEVWPDDNIPDGWTAADVVAEVQKSGSLRNFLNEWDADVFGAEVDVWARGKSERGSLR